MPAARDHDDEVACGTEDDEVAATPAHDDDVAAAEATTAVGLARTDRSHEELKRRFAAAQQQLGAQQRLIEQQFQQLEQQEQEQQHQRVSQPQQWHAAPPSFAPYVQPRALHGSYLAPSQLGGFIPPPGWGPR